MATTDIYSTNINGNTFTQDEYIAFMTKRDNTYKCENCPENAGIKNTGKNPCGQQNCWVTCTCNQYGIRN